MGILIFTQFDPIHSLKVFTAKRQLLIKCNISLLLINRKVIFAQCFFFERADGKGQMASINRRKKYSLEYRCLIYSTITYVTKISK